MTPLIDALIQVEKLYDLKDNWNGMDYRKPHHDCIRRAREFVCQYYCFLSRVFKHPWLPVTIEPDYLGTIFIEIRSPFRKILFSVEQTETHFIHYKLLRRGEKMAHRGTFYDTENGIRLFGSHLAWLMDKEELFEKRYREIYRL